MSNGGGIDSRSGRSEFLLATAGALLLGVGCYLGQQLSIALRVPPVRVSTIWLPGGILLAALLLAPARRWWAYLVGASAGLFVSLLGDAPTPALLAFILLVCGIFSAVAAVLRRLAGGVPRFDHFRHVLSFLLFAGLFMSVLTAQGTAVLAVVSGWRDGFWSLWSRMTLTVVLGLVAVTPVIVSAVAGRFATPRSIPPRRYLEGVGLGFGVLVVAFVVFGGEWSDPVPLRTWLLYAPFPLLLWAAVRFGPGGTSLSVLVIALVSSWNAARGRGPFATPSPEDGVLSLQLSLLAMAVPLLILAALMRERQRTGLALRASEEEARRQLAQLTTVYRTAPVGLAFIDADLRYVSVNDHLAEINGLPAAAHLGRTLHQVLPDRLADELEAVYREVIGKGRPILDVAIRGTTTVRPGDERAWRASHFPVRDGSGAVLGVNTVVREITDQVRAEEPLRRSEAALRDSYEQVQELAGRLIAAQEVERTRIARDLHDDINQRLAALAIALSGLKRRLTDGPAATRDEVERLQQGAMELADDIRHLSHELHPGLLRHAGLVAALEAHCADFRSAHALDVTIQTDDDLQDLPANVSLCLYRVAQEALRNVARHANARNVRLTVSRTADRLELTVADDGRGFDPAEARRGGGLGLRSLDERIRLVRGSVQTDTRPGRGTELRVQVPLGEHAHETGPGAAGR